ncbi:MAG: DUF3102 domain-containing protein [Acidobacteriia bacterium]|nr:DUF3102 domain-containing protein [Terriglobia bacterium]
MKKSSNPLDLSPNSRPDGETLGGNMRRPAVNVSTSGRIEGCVDRPIDAMFEVVGDAPQAESAAPDLLATTNGVTSVPQESTAISAEHIGGLYRRVKESAQQTVNGAIEFGRALAAVKATLKHGEWLPWLKKTRACWASVIVRHDFT